MTETVPLDQLAMSISAHLDGWTWQPDNEHHHVAYLTDGTHRLIITAAHWNQPDRAQIAPAYHDHAPRYERPSITVSRTRDPKAIARDLERRLIPYALEWLDQADQIRQHAETAAKERSETLDRLSELCGYAVHPPAGRPDNATIYYRPAGDGYGTIEASHDGSHATIELRHIPTDLAERIAALLNADA